MDPGSEINRANVLWSMITTRFGGRQARTEEDRQGDLGPQIRHTSKCPIGLAGRRADLGDCPVRPQSGPEPGRRMYGPEALLRNIECNSVMCFGAEEVGVSRLLRLVRGLGKEAALLRVAQFTQSTIPFIYYET